VELIDKKETLAQLHTQPAGPQPTNMQAPAMILTSHTIFAQVSIVEKNGSLGHVSYVGPGMSSGSRRHLINNIFIALAGRAAEEVGLQNKSRAMSGTGHHLCVPETAMLRVTANHLIQVHHSSH
jgi:hypothetical protein